MNRLSEQSGPFGRECYTYDYADNRTGREWFAAMDGDIYSEHMDTTVPDMEMPVADIPLGRECYEYDERNRLVRSILSEGNGGEDIIREYTYDNNGNLLSDGQAAYTYDAFNRMEKAELKDGRTQVNRYDAEGLRHEMEENGKLVQFLYSGRNVVAETENDGNIIRYIRGIGLVSSDSEKAKSYYHYACDELGSVTDIVKGAVRKKLEEEKYSKEEKATETAQVLNHYEYDAFGNTVVCEETVSNRFRFAGEQYDTVTGQYYLRARFYNPVIGRFLQEDDYYGDGLNLYAYCRNNPVMYVDPSGHGKESAADKQNAYDDAQEQFYEDIYDAQRESNPEYEDYLNELADTSDGLESTIPEGYYQDATGRWHRPNGQFASNAEVGKVGSNADTGNSKSSGNTYQGDINANMSDVLNKYGLNRIEDVWGLSGIERGAAIEELLACSDYSDWWHCGAENRGYFPVVDFQNGLDVVSLKSIDPTLPTYQNGIGTKKIISYIDDLNRDITIGGITANRILDVRIPTGTGNCLNIGEIMNYANEQGITVMIKEY